MLRYEDLQTEAKQFLGHCGRFTLNEHARFEEDTVTSVNEILGMAVHLLNEQAGDLQASADAEEGEPKQ